MAECVECGGRYGRLACCAAQAGDGLADLSKVLDFSKKIGPEYFTYAQQHEKWYGFFALWERFCKWLILKNKKPRILYRSGEFPTAGYRFPEIKYPLFTKLSTNKWTNSPA